MIADPQSEEALESLPYIHCVSLNVEINVGFISLEKPRMREVRTFNQENYLANPKERRGGAEPLINDC